ncbi:MAG: C69 family dipeptidase [Bacteroidales bacterium]|nr:C69 family dipeptidase [Bacteroidales bacterium]MCI1784896.1 C69 family dipeptidase [Bacteroidales bacterium]
MKRKSIFRVIAAVALSFVSFYRTEACTNVIISGGASADGSCMVSYAADSHWLYGELYFHPAADWKEGSMLRIYEWDTGRYLGEIPQVAHTYKTVGNMNEHQLIIGETTWGGRESQVDKNGKIDYGSLIYIALQRASTAREAIKVISGLAGKYGYCSEGETFSIADKNEAWIMDVVGKGTSNDSLDNGRKGIVWVARKVPDGYICAHANQARIGKFPLNDPENCLYAGDVISFARKEGYFKGKDEDFSFRDAYCPADFETVRFCDARVWSAFNILCDGKFTFIDDEGKSVTKDSYDYVKYALGYDLSNPLPLFVKPERKVSVKRLADVMRDHYEGTPMDMTTDIGAGGNALPYRWRPLDYEYKGRKYINERAIATQQTGFWFVGQARRAFPDVIGGIIWFGTDDAATSYLTPIYTNIEKAPDCLRVGNGDLITYSASSEFWICNRVANDCYKMYNYMAPFVRTAADKFENAQMDSLVSIADVHAMSMYGKIASRYERRKGHGAVVSDKALKSIRRYLTRYSVNTAQNQFENWVKLERTLFVKFIDGNIKAQNPDGTFRHSEFSVHIPAGLLQPGYTDKWKESVVKDHGNGLLVKDSDKHQ